MLAPCSLVSQELLISGLNTVISVEDVGKLKDKVKEKVSTAARGDFHCSFQATMHKGSGDDIWCIQKQVTEEKRVSWARSSVPVIGARGRRSMVCVQKFQERAAEGAQRNQIRQENLCASLGDGLSPWKCKGVCQQTFIFSQKTIMGLKKTHSSHIF